MQKVWLRLQLHNYRSDETNESMLTSVSFIRFYKTFSTTILNQEPLIQYIILFGPRCHSVYIERLLDGLLAILFVER